VDYIYVLKHGRVAEEGTYQQLMSNNKTFTELMKGHTASLNDQGTEELKDDQKDARDAKEAASSGIKTVKLSRGKSAEDTREKKDGINKAETKKFIEDEEMATGNVQGQIYIDHIKAMGGWPFVIIITIIFGLGQGAVVLSNFVLSWWSQDKYHHDDNWYIIFYAIVAFIAALFLLGRGLVFAVSNTRASRQYHTGLFNSVMHAPATFFDQTPVGRLLNRFTKDISAIDANIPDLLQNLMGVVALLIGNVVAVAVVTPEFLGALAVLGVIFYFIQRAYRASAVQLQRIESVTRSPIYQGFSEVSISPFVCLSFHAFLLLIDSTSVWVV
jgi:ATP-binding cassette subfamily C (CFTR/MRP) protein 1